MELEQYRRELTRYCERIVGTAEADDAVQETMLRAWRAARDFDGRASVRTWLYRIASNTCVDMLRVQQRRGLLKRRLQVSAVQETPADPAELAATSDGVRQALTAVLGQLPSRQRAALILCEVLRWRSDEAAEVLGTTPAAVMSSLQRARSRLAKRANTGAVDEAQLARYVDAFRSYDIDALVRMQRAG